MHISHNAYVSHTITKNKIYKRKMKILMSFTYLSLLLAQEFVNDTKTKANLIFYLQERQTLLQTSSIEKKGEMSSLKETRGTRKEVKQNI